MAQVTWSNALTGQSGTATGTTSWTASVPLAPGTNDITITVTDGAGNVTTSLVSLDFTATAVSVGSGGEDDDKSCGFSSASPTTGSPIAWFAAALGLLALRRRR